MKVRIIMATALVGLALAAAPAVHTNQAFAADKVTVGIGGGGIAFGYNDGYWDRTHAWHAWPSATSMNDYRTKNTTHYYSWKHDRDKDMGWHEDHWWDHH